MNTERNRPLLALGALGVVYGDIGTSPLYAIRESIRHLPIIPDNILGVLSLTFWALIFIVSFKSITLIFKADNEGEGGILALFALLKRNTTRPVPILFWLAIIGAGVLIGDGMLTPAMSVTSAIEGLQLVYPTTPSNMVNYACLILLLLFIFQRYGSTTIGLFFGPIILLWLLVIAGLGLRQILIYPSILMAVNPFYAIKFLYLNGWSGYFALGSVFLVVTGAEALYADIGHFGKKPIRIIWFCIVLPCLLLNYFGQGALLITQPLALNNPFYYLVPKAWMIPLIILATMATVIASQAIITATFSLIRQAILLGIFPRMPMVQTSKYMAGQIFISQMNTILMLGSLFLVLWFKNSSSLAHAYGIGVNLEMILVTILVAHAAYYVWHWRIVKIGLIFSVLILVDSLFLGANIHKFLTGGWIPVCIALGVAFIMFTWKQGMAYLQRKVYRQHRFIEAISAKITHKPRACLPGVNAIFITDQYDHNGSSFLHFLNMSLGFAEHILIVNCHVENQPYIHFSRRFSILNIQPNIYSLTLHYGFMEQISVPQALILASSRNLLPFQIDIEQTLYWVEIIHVQASRTKKTLWFYTQERFFAFLMRNYSVNLNIDFYRLPYERTIAIGTHVVI
ncbi:MAG: KUP/HAK/KT family potassium transporter [Gammaproteobacteria bacterium]|nr:KUP/HAK/KT family potassium transporter [Gammaproteobacteria bacterium]